MQDETQTKNTKPAEQTAPRSPRDRGARRGRGGDDRRSSRRGGDERRSEFAQKIIGMRRVACYGWWSSLQFLSGYGAWR